MEPSISVGIMSAKQIEFSLNGNFVFADQHFTGKQTADFANGKIVFCGNEYEQISFCALDETNSFELKNVTIGINFHWEQQENQRFEGDLKLIAENDEITVINIIKVEKYLLSVISSEMSAGAPLEFLKAHAVISRSWLLANLTEQNHANKTNNELLISDLSNKNRYIKYYERDNHISFDVCADDHCQRYQGTTRATTHAVRQAIESTRGEVLMYENQICDARFSKCCGGASEIFENCWADVNYPYLTKVIDNKAITNEISSDLSIEQNAREWINSSPASFCNTSDKKILSQILNNYDKETDDFFRWTIVYSQKQISEIIAKKSGIDFGNILDLIPVKRGVSARIVELEIVGTKRQMIVGKELEIRRWLSETHLYSSAFTVDKKDIADGIPQQFILTGAGWGHGVGLCQTGAAVMGAKGYPYSEILRHYFINIELAKLY
ncbi:MAG: SpoIID/LytB domain-containing protein [Paludibacter sp.]|jgi:SpoIID/LytB domain protein|nr:SpoIID/LytB domain-containing protein [Paludibacter sp.]